MRRRMRTTSQVLIRALMAILMFRSASTHAADSARGESSTTYAAILEAEGVILMGDNLDRRSPRTGRPIGFGVPDLTQG